MLSRICLGCHPGRAPSGARAGAQVPLSRGCAHAGLIRTAGVHGSRIASLRSPSGMTSCFSSCVTSMRLALDRRRAVGVERLDRLQSPGLALRALGLGPADRLPVGREDESGTGIGDLDAVAAWLVDVEEERLLDGVLVRPGLDEHAVLEKDVGGAQHVLAAV